MRARPLAALVLAASLAATGCRAAPEATPPQGRPALGLMTTLPLIWGEGANIGEVLATAPETGWVRQALEKRFVVEPLDTLEERSLDGVQRLVLAQPRALSPSENVALDAWVRGGGRLLLFADPMLTRHSRFPIGDPRRPQDVILLSPILGHWGLELRYDEAQAAGEQVVEADGVALPVDLPGSFALLPGGSCRLSAKQVIAHCTIGKGTVVAVADAALLDDAEEAGKAGVGTRQVALSEMLAAAFP